MCTNSEITITNCALIVLKEDILVAQQTSTDDTKCRVMIPRHQRQAVFRVTDAVYADIIVLRMSSSIFTGNKLCRFLFTATILNLGK